MSSKSKLFAFAGAVALSMGMSAVAAPIAIWTFETSIPVTAGPLAPEVGAGAATALHASASTVYSNPSGNISAESYSSNFWAVGDYYQFQTSTVGYTGVDFSWDQTGSSTGPKDFKVQYSTDGSTFLDLTTYTVLLNGAPNPSWGVATGGPVYSFAPLSGPAGIFDNQPTLYVRLTDNSTTAINGGTVATGGTDRVDNVAFNGIIPEPATAGALTAAGLMLLSRRRKD
jgi:hypothetical protein